MPSGRCSRCLFSCRITVTLMGASTGTSIYFPVNTGKGRKRAEGVLIAVGTGISARPPHRSVHEALPHTAPTWSRARNRSLGCRSGPLRRCQSTARRFSLAGSGQGETPDTLTVAHATAKNGSFSSVTIRNPLARRILWLVEFDNSCHVSKSPKTFERIQMGRWGPHRRVRPDKPDAGPPYFPVADS